MILAKRALLALQWILHGRRGHPIFLRKSVLRGATPAVTKEDVPAGLRVPLSGELVSYVAKAFRTASGYGMRVRLVL